MEIKRLKFALNAEIEVDVQFDYLHFRFKCAKAYHKPLINLFKIYIV